MNSPSQLPRLSALLLILAVLVAGCGKTESVKNMEAHLAASGSALCRKAEQERSVYIKRGGFGHEERRELFPATVKLLALLHADARLPKVKMLMADVRAHEKILRYIESPGFPGFAGDEAPFVRRAIDDVKEARAELRALGLSACVAKTAAEALG